VANGWRLLHSLLRQFVRNDDTYMGMGGGRKAGTQQFRNNPLSSSRPFFLLLVLRQHRHCEPAPAGEACPTGYFHISIETRVVQAGNLIPVKRGSLYWRNRIVSKVDELFALFDTLKQHLSEAQTILNQLAGMVVGGGIN
jgi:hypothetical protein